ncbi:hypothetical protein FGADI_9560 [Fusarium gaditjirri]|uniref:Zn(2)-C6 fungal-type domain-containing protein n=1 Tax=Fusarium gaditjirri TaxID=282569 RepID=A0A8H4SZL2_9HYPO|nr:hypothetical protein FGADI_9560 [Fusarium gaditjirri]
MGFINLSMPNRRAKQACLHCRGRKIRCDVTSGGSPCVNCRLDQVHCEIKNRKPKRSEGDHVVSKPIHDLPAFISDPDLSQLPPDDVGLLRQHGCLDVPPRPILDEFIQGYFLHVHPMLPLMDECDVFVSESVTKELGFECPRLAAATFYHRAKLLYVLDVETPAVDLARGALLLTFLPVSVGNGHPAPNSVWLTRAIKHAESLGSNHVRHIDGPDTGSLKRLWWCCILRDRSISLGLRRCVQIPVQYPLPAEEDFSSEINGSLFYTPRIKTQLFRIFRRLMAFCYMISDLLQLMARHRSAAHHPETVSADNLTIISKCRENLSDWFSTTGEEFLELGYGSQERHPSVIVYTNFVYIYNTTKLLLHHQKLMVDVGLSGLSEFPPSALGDEVRSATFRFIDHLSEPVGLGLGRFLPVGVAAFAAVPMVMQVFEARFGGQVTADQRRLQTLIEMLKAYQPRFEGVEPLSLLVRQTVNSVESGLTTQGKGCTRSWTDIIAYQPYRYLSCTSEMERFLRSSQAPNGYSMSSSSWSALMDYCSPSETWFSSGVSEAVEGLESIYSLGSLDVVMEMDGIDKSLSDNQVSDSCSLNWDPFTSSQLEDAEPDSSEDGVNLLDQTLNEL